MSRRNLLVRAAIVLAFLILWAGLSAAALRSFVSGAAESGQGLYAAPSYVAASAGLFVLFAAVFLLVGNGTRGFSVELRPAPRTDPLTGVLTGPEFEGAITVLFKSCDPCSHCLIVLDIVAFRRFNAMFGYELGDQLLTVVGRCLSEAYMCATRINSDLFMFVAQNNARAAQDAEHALCAAIRSELGGQYTQMITFKFGVYPLLQHNFNFREAYDGALQALKSAKSAAKAQAVVYDLAMRKQDKLTKFIEMNMIDALGREEYQLYVQPKYRGSNISCCGGEALIRWNSEQMGFLSPVQFIPIFERNGFIAEVDLYMMNKLFAYQQDAIRAGKQVFPISVNQSRVTISFPNYLEKLAQLVKTYSVPLNLVEIEITESILTENYASVITLVGKLKEMGFAVAMDDFGTGYSSLNTLREIPVDVLKIDKEFLRESDTSQKGRKIIQSIINMSRDLGMATVCEGVETGMQLDFLREAGCSMIQGFFLSKPMPYDEYERRFLS